MRKVFVDTVYFIAIINPYDNFHNKAKNAEQNLGQVILVTTEMILTELLDGFAERGTEFRRVAVELVKQLQSNPNIKIRPQTSVQFNESLKRYSERLDKGWSLTDCASMLVMEKEKIEDVLTHDRHFQQAGFTTLLRD